ncbi:MAG: MCE family protein [Nocardioidaceae bacterium]|nr:MCE family protein [Nocardioidaceae bacterium]MCL2611843.1 MCE family protein [Nocardioidaceae bacterium]
MPQRYPRSFAERNRILIAIVGLALLAATFFVTFNADSMPVIGGGEEHQVYFAEAGGIRSGDEVRVAGVKVGKVTGVELDGAKVLVTFQTKGVRLGDQTSAAVKVKTLLGQKYLAIAPLGTEDLVGAIPVDHTTTPYDVNAALSDLSTRVQRIDTKKMARSLDVLSGVLARTPKALRGTVEGLTRLSRTISSRDTQLASLFRATNKVTGTLAGRTTEIGKLVDDGNTLLEDLAARRKAVHRMLSSTATLGTAVKRLVRDNQRSLRPALAKLDRVATILRNNQSDLDKAVAALGPYYRMLATSMGNGRWVDSYICGLFDNNDAPVLKNDVLRNCHPGGAR